MSVMSEIPIVLNSEKYQLFITLQLTIPLSDNIKVQYRRNDGIKIGTINKSHGNIIVCIILNVMSETIS